MVRWFLLWRRCAGLPVLGLTQLLSISIRSYTHAGSVRCLSCFFALLIFVVRFGGCGGGGGGSGSSLPLLNPTFPSRFLPPLSAWCQRVAVPGLTLHPTGALVYEPFLDRPAPVAPPATGIHGGIDIRDAHNGRLRLRLVLPELFAMLSTDIDGQHGDFLTTDEFGQRLFAITASGLTVVQLASVPLAFGSISPVSATSAGGTSLTIRGSGFQSSTKATLGGKQASVTFLSKT
jgi:IPT/TIG domain